MRSNEVRTKLSWWTAGPIVLALLTTACQSPVQRAAAPRLPATQQAKLAEGREALFRGDRATAARLFGEVVDSTGHPTAQLALARLYLQGIDGARDPARASELLDAARGRRSPVQGQAAFELAHLVANGDGVAADPERARALYAEALDLGVAAAGVPLGIMRLKGEGGPVDLEGAQRALERAAADGNPWAMVRLAEARRAAGASEQQVAEILWQGIAELERRALARHAGAARELLRIDREQVASVSPERKRTWLRYAADGGDVNATAALGFALLPDDRSQGLAWLQRAAEAGQPSAQAEIGRRRLAGDGLERDVAAGLMLLENAAAAGSRHAMTVLATAYGRGDPLARDPEQARRWWQQAAELGDKNATLQLARLLVAEDASATDRARGRALLEQLAAEGDRDAMAQLGFAFQREDPAFAIAWFERAAEAGHAAAMAEIGRRKLTGDGLPADPGRGLDLLKQASGQGSAWAMFLLGEAYADGRGVPADAELARKWLAEGAAKGHQRAQARLAALEQRS